MEKARYEFEAACVRVKEELTARSSSSSSSWSRGDPPQLRGTPRRPERGDERIERDATGSQEESERSREERRSDRTQKLHEKREVALQRLMRGSPEWREAR